MSEFKYRIEKGDYTIYTNDRELVLLLLEQETVKVSRKRSIQSIKKNASIVLKTINELYNAGERQITVKLIAKNCELGVSQIYSALAYLVKTGSVYRKRIVLGQYAYPYVYFPKKIKSQSIGSNSIVIIDKSLKKKLDNVEKEFEIIEESRKEY